MFKKIFGRDKSETPARSLDHPRKLKQGDFIKIGFDDHPEISNTEFMIQKVTGLDLSAKSGYERSVIHLGLTDNNRICSTIQIRSVQRAACTCPERTDNTL